MNSLLNKRQDILKDIEAINERMRELESEHAQRIIQLHELRGAQRVVDGLIEAEEQRQATEDKEKAALKQAVENMRQSALNGHTALSQKLENLMAAADEEGGFDEKQFDLSITYEDAKAAAEGESYV